MTYEWLPMNDDVFEWLSWWYKNRPLDLAHVFYSLSKTGGKGGGRGKSYGKPFKKRSKFIKSLSKKAGLDSPLGYHHLRHFVATEMAKNGRTTKEIQRFLRHKDVSTTEGYIRFGNVDLKAAVQSLVKGKRDDSRKDVGP